MRDVFSTLVCVSLSASDFFCCRQEVHRTPRSDMLSSERRGTCGETYISNKARSVFCGRVRVSRSFDRRHRRGGTRYSRVLSPCHLCRMTSSALLPLCILNKISKKKKERKHTFVSRAKRMASLRVSLSDCFEACMKTKRKNALWWSSE